MTSFRWPLSLLAVGSLCIAIAFAMPAPRNPRLEWTDEKSASFHQTHSEMHSLSHELAEAAGHSNDPNHIHTPTDSTDPLLTALELERAQERSAELHKQLEDARTTPAGWNLLFGVVGILFVVVGGVVALTAIGKK